MFNVLNILQLRGKFQFRSTFPKEIRPPHIYSLGYNYAQMLMRPKESDEISSRVLLIYKKHVKWVTRIPYNFFIYIFFRPLRLLQALFAKGPLKLILQENNKAACSSIFLLVLAILLNIYQWENYTNVRQLSILNSSCFRDNWASTFQTSWKVEYE